MSRRVNRSEVRVSYGGYDYCASGMDADENQIVRANVGSKGGCTVTAYDCDEEAFDQVQLVTASRVAAVWCRNGQLVSLRLNHGPTTLVNQSLVKAEIPIANQRVAGVSPSSPIVVQELYRRAKLGSCHPPELVALLAQTGDGDHAALKQLYQATSAKLFSIISRVLFDRHEAEDVLQEVYVTVWRQAARYDAARASPMTWLITIARNRAIDRLRVRASRPTTTLDGAVEVCDAAPSADLRLEQNQEGQRLAAALATLDPRYADTIRSIFFERLTYAALAAREGISANTLKSWVRRGLQLLRNQLEYLPS